MKHPPSLKRDPRGYGAIPATEIIATVGDGPLAWRLCNRRLHVVRALRSGHDAALATELELIDATLNERGARIDIALAEGVSEIIADMRRAV